MRLWATRYERGGTRFLRRGVVGIHGLGFMVALISTSLLLPLFAHASIGDTLVLGALAFIVYAAEGALTIRSTSKTLARLDSWLENRDSLTAEITWEAVADIPFAPLRSIASHTLVAVLIPVWDLLAVWRLHLNAASVPALLAGSLLLWVYWLALRFFTTERLMRPALADISTMLPDHDAKSNPVRITLIRRLLVSVPAVTVITGAAVDGIVGDHTRHTVAAGAAASILVSVCIAGWMLVLLAQSITEPIDELRAAATRVGYGDLQTRVPVVSVDEIGSLARSFNAMVAGLRERDHIRDTFGAYVDPVVAGHILAHGTALNEGEEVEITALFLDVRGFTGYSETHTASEVVAMLNRLFELVVPIVACHGGHVDKFIGDGLLAVFGTPQPLPDHASQALAAATEICAAEAARTGDDPQIGIGLNSGAVVAGNLGGAGRYDFSVIGDVVNVAARVESATRQTGDTILVSEQTRRLLPPHLASRLKERPDVPLRGKTEPVSLYAT